MVMKTIILGPEFDAIPDDTEETLVGSSNHQGAIHTLFDGLRLCAKQRDLPWYIGNQLTLLVQQEGRALPRRFAPDVILYPTLAVTEPSSLSVILHGPPALAIEIASPSTALDSDINLFEPSAKPQLYDRIGVEEYLVFDPTGEILGSPVWARRRGPDGMATWNPEADGRWHSTLGVSFAPQGALLRVHDHEGHLMPTSFEFAAMLAESERQRAESERQRAALEAEVRRLRGE